jgi:prefoldin subunit 5
MKIEEIKELKKKFFKDEEEVKKFLIFITKELLNSKITSETISPLLLTHKEFIDTSLGKLLKKIKEKLFQLAEKRGIKIVDEIMKIKIEYLAGYLLKYDMANERVIHKTIAKYILNIVRNDFIKLNRFVSTLNREVYSGKYGKFRYPPLYPFDKERYNNPLPLLKQLLNRIDSVKKTLQEKEKRLKQISFQIDNFEREIEQIRVASTDMNEIVAKLKNRYVDSEKELKARLVMIKNQHSRFAVLLKELREKISSLKEEEKSLSKNIENFKERYRDILQKEEEIIDVISKNLATMKVKIVT